MSWIYIYTSLSPRATPVSCSVRQQVLAMDILSSKYRKPSDSKPTNDRTISSTGGAIAPAVMLRDKVSALQRFARSREGLPLTNFTCATPAADWRSKLKLNQPVHGCITASPMQCRSTISTWVVSRPLTPPGAGAWLTDFTLPRCREPTGEYCERVLVMDLKRWRDKI